jgi:endoglucanase
VGRESLYLRERTGLDHQRFLDLLSVPDFFQHLLFQPRNEVRKASAIIVALGLCVLWSSCGTKKGEGCLTGAFLADVPKSYSIEKFSIDYGKRPALILIFLDWGKFPDGDVVRDVYDRGSMLVVTWEPWQAKEKKAIDYDAVLDGKSEAYIREFALKLKSIEKTVFLRFAHEMNGNWYPWSGQKIGGEKYQHLFKYVRKIFAEVGVENVRWVFSINTENVPQGNAYRDCYPGDRFVDYIGLDGYNWGTTQSWSRWKSFRNIFSSIYEDVVRRYKKPVIISEFSSASAGGDKALWIEGALQAMRRMPAVKGFILFNVDKEADWRFPPDSASGQKLKSGLANPYFQRVSKKSL